MGVLAWVVLPLVFGTVCDHRGADQIQPSGKHGESAWLDYVLACNWTLCGDYYALVYRVGCGENKSSALYCIRSARHSRNWRIRHGWIDDETIRVMCRTVTSTQFSYGEIEAQ